MKVMSKFSTCILFLVVFLQATALANTSHAWTFWVNDYDGCVEKYAVNAETTLATKVIMNYCNKLYGSETKPSGKNKNFLDCVIKNIGSKKNETAVKLQIRLCREKTGGSSY
jgi:hypothetical protein